ncbi:hypothetical protein MTR_6g086765 [Medicago truncatula]|uniref:Uncharacterized protein n=1 Tax=Medicago truncatula TaxID=3880 RepID=A0A072UMM9_MEDTR|nr:hypothetical protein MTR_6g086765 [Medicago truncatula]
MCKCKGLGCKLGTCDNMNESEIGKFDMKVCGYHSVGLELLNAARTALDKIEKQKEADFKRVTVEIKKLRVQVQKKIDEKAASKAAEVPIEEAINFLYYKLRGSDFGIREKESENLGLGSVSYGLVRLALIKELIGKRNGGEDRLKFLIDSLYPPKEKTSIAPEEKWLTAPDMGHVIATLYSKVVVVLKHGNNFSETCFPPSARIMCLNHFVHVFLRPGCPIPPTTPQWKKYKKLGRITLLRGSVCLMN